MANLEVYKPHIRVKFYAEVENKDMARFLPPIIVNKYPDDLEMSCTVVRDCLQGNFALTFLLDVVNLNAYVKWQLLNKKYKYVVVYAGYLGTDYYDVDEESRDDYIDSRLKIIFKGYILWMGNIVEARRKVTTRFLAVQNPSESLSAYTDSVSLKFSAGYNLYQLIHDIARISNNLDIKINLAEEYKEGINLGVDSDVNLFDRKSLDYILNAYGITITQGFDITEGYITEETYAQMNSERRAPGEDNTVVVTEDTGLIDIPTLQTSGDKPTVRFKMLFDSRVRDFNYVKLRNSDIQLPSEVSDATDVPSIANSGIFLDMETTWDEELGKEVATGWGYYLVLKITYSLNSRGNEFIQEIEASPYDTYNKILTGEYVYKTSDTSDTTET